MSELDALSPTVSELESGLTVAVVPMPALHRVVLNVHLRVGPLFELTEQNGISHFLEHMLYRGTAGHPTAHSQADAFESLGGTLVATTLVDHGSIAIAVPPASLEAVFPLFGEVFAHPLFDGIETEKGIVREELLEGLDDDGRSVDADELIRASSFEGHPLGNPITGTAERLDRFDRDMLLRHHRTHYVGAGSVLAVAGPVEPERVLALARRAFADIPRGERPIPPRLPEQTAARYRYVRYAASQTDLRVAFRAPADGDPLEPATDLLLRVIDDGMSTRLYHRLCDERGLCYDVSAGYEAYVEGGIFDLAAETANAQAPRVLGELLELSRELREDGPTEAELDKAKARLRWHFEEMLDDPGEVASFLALGLLSGVARSPRERRERLLSVTTEQVRSAAQCLFRRERMSVVAVGSLTKKDRDALSRNVDAFK